MVWCYYEFLKWVGCCGLFVVFVGWLLLVGGLFEVDGYEDLLVIVCY